MLVSLISPATICHDPLALNYPSLSDHQRILPLNIGPVFEYIVTEFFDHDGCVWEMKEVCQGDALQKAVLETVHFSKTKTRTSPARYVCLPRMSL